MQVGRTLKSIPTAWQIWSLVFSLTLAATLLVARGADPGFDVGLSRAVQDLRTPLLEPLSQALYLFGLYPLYPLVGLAAAAWFAFNRQYLAAAFLAAAFASRALVTPLKELVERPRPTGAEISLVEGASGFSFPSGHVLGAFLAVGALWFVLMQTTQSPLKRALLTAAAGAAILLMGLQRVYAGAHWTTDVIGAYLWGWLLLFLLVQLYRLAESRLQRRGRLQAISG